MGANKSKQYWKGLEEFNKEPEFEEDKHHEFAEHLPIDDVLSENDLNLESNRRDFLKFMGFTISSATLAACSKSPVKKAIPYVDKPPESDPGLANYYATTSFATNEAVSILVKTRDGRPIKIEPNNQAPLTEGGTSASEQASVLSLYDHSRLRGPVKNNDEEISWSKADNEIKSELQKISDKEGHIKILTGTILSPTTQSVIDNFKQQYNNVEHIQYDPASSSAMIKANKESFDKPYIPDFKLDEAKTIVSFNADFLGTWIAPVEFTKKYSTSRKVDKYKDMSFHVQFESTMSLTGSNADLRAPIKPSQEGAALVSLYNRLAQKAGVQKLPEANMEFAANAIKMTSEELWKNKGKTVVISGTNDYNIQLLTNKINALLENYGSTISFKHASRQRQGDDIAMEQLVNSMNKGQVDALFLDGVNPLYDYYNSESFKKGLGNVGLTVSLNERNDETSQEFTYNCPKHHYLESWDDAQPKLGYFHLTQPTISPIFNTRAVGESFLRWAGSDENYYDYLRRFWNENLFKNQSHFMSFRQFWNHAVHDGFYKADKGVEANVLKNSNNGSDNSSSNNGVADTTLNGATKRDTVFKASVAAATISQDEKKEVNEFNQFNKNLSAEANHLIKAVKNASGNEIVLYQKVGVRDGVLANNPWIQEMPDPISKISWDNYACVSPKMAKEQDLNDEDLINIKVGNQSIELPVYRQPGQPHGTIGIALGYGHQWGATNGKVANDLGKNAYPIVTTNNKFFSYSVSEAEFSKTGSTYPLAQTQTHHHIEGRDLIHEAPMKQYLDDPKSVEHHSHHVISLYKDYNYNKTHHWAMAIDLNACTGCGSCVISCQAENNVPVVGKQEVRRRREMHWIRVDRYFGGDDPENPDVNFQPLMCQHCDNAPCENVCPVAAISHSDSGINQQVYNRCVGTRYCANNCPYKVRRFNWYKYAENEENEKFNDTNKSMNSDLGRMVLNPDVTVRSRGVMEKCSFCVQRIQSSKLKAKNEGRGLEDGETKTACQTACPANAIVFGDLNDPESEVAQLVHENHRSYGILTEVGTKPSVSYMTKIRNRDEVQEGGHSKDNEEGGHA